LILVTFTITIISHLYSFGNIKLEEFTKYFYSSELTGDGDTQERFSRVIFYVV